jgi:uncharacterized FlaG/YvyC family protein
MSNPTISSLGRAAVELTGSLNSPRQEKRPVSAPTQPVKNNQAVSAYAQTRLQFQVDSKTNDVIILIRDKESDKIVRTIPAEAIRDIPPGQILQTSG